MSLAPRCEIAAYYFPNYHVDPRNESWHGKGWTEWELVKAAQPRFPGHRQPLTAAWGYFDESDPAWAAREIDLAADHGISCFLYDWYWYEDGPFLADALDRGFLGAPNNSRLKFALMWANHDWIDIHPAKFRNRPEVLAPGRISLAAFELMTDRIVERYFSRANYLKIEGRPYFSLYQPASFVIDMGGWDAAADALKSFHEKARAAGFEGVHINAVAFGLTVLPGEIKLDDPASAAARLGLSSVTSYVWIHHHSPDTDGFPMGSYAAAAEANYAAWERLRAMFSVPYYPNVTMGWDSSPRTVQTDRFEARGYPFTAILSGNSPRAFGDALVRARAFVDKMPTGPKMITINAWNEWTEGSYLLPDTEHGTAYLEAIRAVFPP